MIDTIKRESKLSFDSATHTIIMVGGFGIFGAQINDVTGLVIELMLGILFVIKVK